VQSRVKRAGFDLQNIPGLGANPLANGIAMLGAPLQFLKNEHVERSLQKLNPVQIRLASGSHSVDTLHPKQVERLLAYPSDRLWNRFQLIPLSSPAPSAPCPRPAVESQRRDRQALEQPGLYFLSGRANHVAMTGHQTIERAWAALCLRTGGSAEMNL
jgi:hypothetical protein